MDAETAVASFRVVPEYIFRLFGTLHVVDRRSGQDLTPRGRKARAVLALLALGHDTIERAGLAELLWSDRPANQARASLRQVLFELVDRKTSGSSLINASVHHVSRHGIPWRTDIDDILFHAAAGDLTSLGDCLVALQGELLAGLDGISPDFDNWLRIERVRQREAIVAASLAAIGQTWSAPARSVVNALEAFDPGDEKIVRAGLEQDSAAGDVASLHRRYQRLAGVLSREFGVRPSLETRSLFDRLTAPPRIDSKPFAGAGDAQPLLAVLAFDNLSIDPDLAYFAEGVSEEVLQSVSRIEGLKVIGRASSFQFRGSDRAAAFVGQQLGVTHVLDGTVRRSRNRLRISVQLIETASETVAWSDRFDREAGDILAVQEDIAVAIAAVLQARFVPVAPGRIDARAYELYIQGRRIAGPSSTRQKCMELYESALVIAPNFADAWSSLAIERALAARWDDRPDGFSVLAERVREAAGRALQLDPGSVRAQIALSLLEPHGAYRALETTLDQAAARKPEDAELLRFQSDSAYTVGRVRDAFRFISRAHQVDPLNLQIAQRYAMMLAEIGLLPESQDAYAFARSRWPDIYWLISDPWLNAAFLEDWATADAMGALANAFDSRDLDFARFIASTIRSPEPNAMDTVRAIAEQAISSVGFVNISTFVLTYRLGLIDETFGWLERSNYAHVFDADGRGPDTTGFVAGIIFGHANTRMRRDPRFVRLCAKLGLNRYWVETGRWPDCIDETSAYYDFTALARADVERDQHPVPRLRGPPPPLALGLSGIKDYPAI